MMEESLLAKYVLNFPPAPSPFLVFKDKGYVVLNRPIGFKRFLDVIDIEEDYIYMGEPDHLLLMPFKNTATLER